MSNPDGHPQQTPPSESGSGSSEPSSGGHEAPPIEQSTTPPGYFPPPAYEQPGYSPQGYEQHGYGPQGNDQPGFVQQGYDPSAQATPTYPPPPAYPPPVPGYGQAYPPPPPPYGAYGSPYDVGPGYPRPPYGVAYPGEFASQRTTNQLAIWSLVASLLGFICCVGSVTGVVLGVMSLNQIKQNNEGGRGLAIAGIAVGAVTLIVSTLIWVGVVASS